MNPHYVLFFLIFWLFFKKVSTFIEYAIRSTIKTCCCWCCCNYSQKQRTKQKIWRRKKIITKFLLFNIRRFPYSSIFSVIGFFVFWLRSCVLLSNNRSNYFLGFVYLIFVLHVSHGFESEKKNKRQTIHCSMSKQVRRFACIETSHMN